MYLDQKGWVTTGIGNKIDETAAPTSPPSPAERAASLAEATQLRWLDEAASQATPDQVASDWDTVKSHLELASAGYRAFQPPMTKLHLEDDEIDRHVFTKVDQMETFLLGRTDFAEFASWPANAQLATLSMCWALGPAFQFPRFQGHVAVRDWNGAADECHFNPDVGTIMIRNKLDRSHFLLAQAVTDQGLAPEAVAVDLSDVFGVQGALIALGYKPGLQDGADGPSTQRALCAFQSDNGLDQNGAFNDPATISALGTQLSDRGFTVLGG
jgi:hypothetical protein